MSPSITIVFFVFFAISSLSFGHAPRNLNGGFGVRLIHRDCPQSPSYNPNATTSDRHKSAYRRSTARHNFIDSLLSSSYSSNDLKAPLTKADGDYFMKISIGTPPVDIMALVDTGSDLIWIQSSPCIKCYEQDGPFFDPSKSSTYSKYSCYSQACDDLIRKECTDDDICQYYIAYGDGSRSEGILSSDTFTMTSTNGSIVSLPEMVFGCGNDNRGPFAKEGGGIVGLSGGSLSLISQLGMQMGSRFSHCFIPQWSEERGYSHLYIGENAVLFGNSTRLSVQKRDNGVVFYFLSLEDISVGSERLGIPAGTFDRNADGSGGVIIDSGTRYTRLNSVAFDMMAKKLREVIKLEPVEDEDDEAALCYKGSREDLADLKVPSLTFHFWNLEVPVHSLNSFIEEPDGVVCLAMTWVNGVSIIGNHAQQNMNVGFDLDKQELTMAPAVCSTF